MQHRGNVISDAVYIHIVFCFAIPSSWPKHKQELAKAGHIRHTSKPDTDNLQKFYMDCLSNIILKDDAQVDMVFCKKIYSTNPKTVIKIFKGTYAPEIFLTEGTSNVDGDELSRASSILDRPKNTNSILAESPNAKRKKMSVAQLHFFSH